MKLSTHTQSLIERLHYDEVSSANVTKLCLWGRISRYEGRLTRYGQPYWNIALTGSDGTTVWMTVHRDQKITLIYPEGKVEVSDASEFIQCNVIWGVTIEHCHSETREWTKVLSAHYMGRIQ